MAHSFISIPMQDLSDVTEFVPPHSDDLQCEGFKEAQKRLGIKTKTGPGPAYATDLKLIGYTFPLETKKKKNKHMYYYPCWNLTKSKIEYFESEEENLVKEDVSKIIARMWYSNRSQSYYTTEFLEPDEIEHIEQYLSSGFFVYENDIYVLSYLHDHWVGNNDALFEVLENDKRKNQRRYPKGPYNRGRYKPY